MKSKNINPLIKISQQDISYFSHHGSRFLLNAVKYFFSWRSLSDFNNTEILLTKVLLTPGMTCELMNSDGLSSQIGKLKITVEFIPDVTEVLPPMNVSDGLAHEPSPLDWLR